MARYTQQQLRAVLEIDKNNEYVLVCGPGTDTALIDPAIRQAGNVEIRHLPPSTQRPGTADDRRVTTLERAEAFQAWLATLDLDLFHATAPFLSAEPFLTTFDVCPLVATLYDVIPLLYPEHYLPAPADRDSYLFALSVVRRANRLIAISEATRHDAAAHLDIAPDRIDVAYPIVDACFRPLSHHQARAILAANRDRARIPERFALTVSFPHHSKNLDTLLHAYSLLPGGLRLEMPLVVCCLLDPKGAGPVWEIADKLSISDDLVLTGVVTDRELAALYSEASLLVHPSRYEGFGLPVAEAMSCGTPVITTTSSSLPEVGGDAAVLVDPDDVEGMADAIRVLADDNDGRREAMIAEGLAHSARFNAGALARATLDSYERTSPEPVSDRPRVAIWTPLPPQESGIADTVAELLDEMSRTCDVEVFVDDAVVPSPELLGRYPVHHFSAFARRETGSPFDAVIYQMGASVLHLYMYEPLQQHPGIVALHDLPWSYVLWAYFNSHHEPERFRAELAALEGDAAVDELISLEQEAAARGEELGDSSSLDFWARRPMLGRVVEASLAQIVHGDVGVTELRHAYPTAQARSVPLGVGDPYETWPATNMKSARQQLGLDPGAFIVGVFGIVHPAKRIEACIRATAELAVDDPDVLLLVAGRVLDDSYERSLTDLAAGLGVAANVRLTGPVTFDSFLAHQVACDVIVNLRSPLVRQWSGTLMRGLAAGKPVIMSDVPYWRSFPDDVCPRIPTDDSELGVLTQALRTLHDDEAHRARLSGAVRAYFEDNATVADMAGGYFDVIEEVTGRTIPRPGTPASGPKYDKWAELVQAVGS
jgi:glycosyltransferase involved in cell wall biosynthesis